MEKKVRKILSELNDGRIAVSQATEQVLALFSVSKRFNFPNFIAGVTVGILICTIIIELAY